MSELIPAKSSLPESEYPATEQLIADLRGLIESARTRVAVAANREQTLLYWDLGQRIREDILHEKRALRQTNCLDSVETIDSRLWAWIRANQYFSHASIC